MGYVEDYDLMADTTNDLHKKVARAIDKAARDVVNEDPATANHASRLVWAKNVRANPSKPVELAHQWMLHVLDNVTVAAAGNLATDNDVQFVVTGLVNEMAGI